MMKLNTVIVEGELMTEVSYAVTEKHGDDAASFILCIDRSTNVWNKIRVNVFGDRVKECQQKKLSKGSRVVVFGEIMTRIGSGPMKSYTNDIRMFRVICAMEEDFVQTIRQSLSDQLSLDKMPPKRTRGDREDA